MALQVLDYALVSPTSPADVGNCGMDPQMLSVAGNSDTEPSASDYAEYANGRLLWSYTVPPGSQLTMKSLTHVASHAVQAGNIPSGVGAYIEAGVVKLKKNGTTFFEQRWHAPNIYGPTPDNSGGGCPSAFIDHMPGALFNVGGTSGITFVGNTDTLTAVVTPNLGDTGTAFYVTAVGKKGSVADVQTGFGMLDGPTADTTIFTYAPTTDWTLRTIKIHCICIGSVIYTQMRMTVNGRTVMILPKICHNQWGTAPDPLELSMWGITFAPGDVIALYGHVLLDVPHLLSTMMAGSLLPVSSGPTVGRSGSIVRRR